MRRRFVVHTRNVADTNWFGHSHHSQLESAVKTMVMERNHYWKMSIYDNLSGKRFNQLGNEIKETDK